MSGGEGKKNPFRSPGQQQQSGGDAAGATEELRRPAKSHCGQRKAQPAPLSDHLCSSSRSCVRRPPAPAFSVELTRTHSLPPLSLVFHVTRCSNANPEKDESGCPLLINKMPNRPPYQLLLSLLTEYAALARNVRRYVASCNAKQGKKATADPFLLFPSGN